MRRWGEEWLVLPYCKLQKLGRKEQVLKLDEGRQRLSSDDAVEAGLLGDRGSL